MTPAVKTKGSFPGPSIKDKEATPSHHQSGACLEMAMRSKVRSAGSNPDCPFAHLTPPNAVSFPLAHLGYESLIHASYILLSKLTALSSTGYSHPTSLLWNFQGTQNLSELNSHSPDDK